MSFPDEPEEQVPDEGIGRGSSTARGSLRQTTARGVLWSFASSGGQAFLQIVSLAVLGRLLLPSEFGLVAAATLVVGFTTVIGQVGVSAALVQKPQLSREETGAGFVVAILTSVILTGIVWLFVPLLVPLLGIPQGSSGALRLLVLVIVITGVGAVPLGLLQRALKFRAIASVDITAYAVGAVGLSIVLAVAGFGAYSLIWGQIATVAVQSVGYLILSRSKPRLGSPREATAAAWQLLRFGLPYSIGQIGNWIAGNGDNFIVATQLTAANLGVYSRAFQLLAAPANLIGGVADRVLFPAMAAVQHDRARMMSAYVTSSAFVAMLTVPASVAMFAAAPDVVHVLLGSGWNGVIPLLQVFAIVLLPRASYKISGSFTRARGAVTGGAWRQWLYAGEVVVFCLIGSRWGVVGVAVGASVAMILHYLVMLGFSAQVAPGLWRMLGRAYLRYIPLVIVCVLVAIGVVFALGGVHVAIVRLLVIGFAVLIAAVIVVAIMRRSFHDELSLVGSIVRRRRPPVSATETPEETP